MALKNLATAAQVQSILKTNSILVEVGGSIRRITLDKLIESINAGEEELLRSVAWGIPIKQSTQTSSAWGRVGNLDMWALFKSQCGRYLVKNNGHAAKLSVTNSGVYADGTTLNESLGHVMVHFPKLYYRVQEDAVTGIPYLWMSLIPIGGHFIPEATIGAYKASMASTALVSRSGVAPAGNKTISAFWAAAQVNGAKWGLINYDHKKLMMMLLMSEYGSPNAQEVLGAGITGESGGDWSAASSMLTGLTKSLGDAFGKVDITYGSCVNPCRVSVMGIEDPYGWQWEFTQGIFCGNSGNTGQNGNEVFIYEGNRLPSAAELASHPDGDYRQLTRLTSEGFIREETVGEFFDLVPSVHGGGGSQYWGDYHYANATGQVLLWGGAANDGAYCGLAYAYSNNAWSYSRAYIGSRLAYYGELTVMSGRELVAES